MTSNRTVSLAFAAASLWICGCRTDAFMHRQPVKGAPVTVLESVELARQSEMSLAGAREVDLVEQLAEYRHGYLTTLEHLRDYYRQHGYAEKYRWAEGELADVRRIKPYHYLLDSELPRLDLEPGESIPEADRLYAQAVRKAADAGHGVPALYNQERMGEALQMFKQVIREYPTSDKIDDAAFYCGELYKEYFPGQDSVAVEWYERAWTWDPATPHPARFQAAYVYDYRLHDRKRALELYRAAIAAEGHYKSDTAVAVERIKQLTGSGPMEGYRTQPVAPTSHGSVVPAGQQGQRGQ